MVSEIFTKKRKRKKTHARTHKLFDMINGEKFLSLHIKISTYQYLKPCALIQVEFNPNCTMLHIFETIPTILR